MRRSLAIAQLAICLVLLVEAGLLMRTFLNLLNVSPGFDPRNAAPWPRPKFCPALNPPL